MAFVNKTYHGAQPNADLDPNLLRRDVRPLGFKIRDAIANYAGFFLVLLGVIAFVLPFSDFPVISDFLLVIGLLFYFYARKRLRTYNFRKPMDISMSEKERGNAGIMLIGNQMTDGSGVWFSNDDLRTHMLIFGSTRKSEKLELFCH